MKPMTAAEVAAKANVSLSLVYAVLKSGKLKAMRIGVRGRGCWRVLVEDFERWMGSCQASEIVPEEGGSYRMLK